MNKSLHIVSFDNPYPPTYGGIIDVFYKIEALNKLGITIILHLLSDKKEEGLVLKGLCSKIFYYKRKNLIFSLLSTTPYRVKSRFSKELINNLTSIKAPILFEGLHSTMVLNKYDFKTQKTYVRTHNIEHLYHHGLANSSSKKIDKLAFKIEAVKFEKYEEILQNVSGIFTISPYEQSYFSNKYNVDTWYIPVFHENSELNYLSESKHRFVLFHGDLRVADNIKASLFLIDVFKNSDIPLVIASGTKNKDILHGISINKNHSFVNITDNYKLEKLLKEAHVNILPTFQKTGIKLKLINALFKGKFVVVNDKMIEETGLEKLCVIANSKSEILKKTNQLLQKEFTIDQLQKRSEQLTIFDTQKNAQKIIDSIFN